MNKSYKWITKWLYYLLICWSETDTKHHLHQTAAHSFHSCGKKIFTTEVWPRKYKQQKRTPLLFLTGKSPEVIFLLPWNKSMKQSSLWTIAHLLKSDAGQGGSHHRADSVCWQRILWLKKKKKRLFFETGVQAWVQFGDVIQKTDSWEAVC